MFVKNYFHQFVKINTLNTFFGTVKLLPTYKKYSKIIICRKKYQYQSTLVCVEFFFSNTNFFF